MVNKEEGGSLVISQHAVVETVSSLPQISKYMKIFSVLGFGLLILMLKFLTPKIFTGLENTLLVFFQTAQTILSSGTKSPFTAGFLAQ
jgi:hypothetical protein